MTGNATVTLTIASKTMIDITPQVLNYNTQDPGTMVVNYTYNSLNLSQIQIENIGSTNLTHVWFNTSQPTVRPFGTGVVTNYDAANFLAIKNSSMSENEYAFVDRLEFNHSTDIVYLTLPTNYKRQGRLRVGPNEYFWATASDGSYCNGTGVGKLHLGTTAHTIDETGDIDLSDGSKSIVGSGDSSWGVVDKFTIGSADYCAAVSADCSKVRFYRWNADAPGTSGCSLDEVYSSNKLTPGDSFAVDLRLYVPYGVPVGAVTNGTLTVMADVL
ncbi:MAG: hypothetical protein DRN71_01990 [Candidatus Nanohalarchaeota archaeon]|nr:MAG: hypothetical protein DRN71_01990 [Candidatus Nanohaloarchaeota archaeon]